jgi:hypothetical protein
MLFNFSFDATLMPQWINEFLLSSPEDCHRITSSPNYRQLIQSHCRTLADMAYEQQIPEAFAAFHQCLNLIYDNEFSIVLPTHTEADTQPVLKDIVGVLEREMLDDEYSLIDAKRVTDYPENGAAYIKWLKELISNHPANAHPFYRDFLRNHSTSEDIRFYLAQETSLDPRFDDILALLQIGTFGRAKMDIACNYWDEMGNGDPEKVHTHLFSKALHALNADATYVADNLLDESRISGNLSAAFALNRRHHFKAIGYFGVTEYIAPSRFKNLVKAWRRNKLPEDALAYHELHVTIDAVHGNSWFNNVIAPSIDQAPAIGREIALGACVRLNSSARYLNSILEHLLTRRIETPFAEKQTMPLPSANTDLRLLRRA